MVAVLVNTDDTCEINSPFSSSRRRSCSSSSSSSSSEEEEVIQPEPGRGRKRTRRALPKRKDTDFELGWKEKIQMVQKPVFSSVPGINKNSILLKTALRGICFKYSSAQKFSSICRRKRTGMRSSK